VDTPEDLAYAEAVRSIEQQARSLDELRSRTGVLLTGASIVASFLGAQALRTSSFDALSGLAVVAFLGVLTLALAVLWPREWRWSFGATILLEDWADVPSRRDDIPAMRRFLAERLDANWVENKKKMDKLFVFWQLAAVSLGAEVVLWTLKLA